MRAVPETPAQQLAWIRETTVALPDPKDLPLPPEFDPRTARSEQLRDLGFPPRPDPETQEELYTFWVEQFSLPLEFERASLAADIDFALPNQFQSAGRATTPSRREASLNWSGAYITPRDGRMFTHVVGSFSVPSLAPPTGIPGVVEFRSSTWIGLDGQRSYLNSTLPQIGTAQHLTSGNPVVQTNTAWIQWWPLLPFTFKNFQVNAGDRMMCWLNVVDSTHVLGVIRNLKTKQIRMFIMLAPMVVDPPLFPTAIQAKVSGATAEWVTERPAHLTSPVLYELPNYGKVVFEKCYAGSALGPSAAVRVERLVGPKLVRMYRVAANPHRSVTISVAKRLAYDSVKTSYR